jgi:hypothetical protein
VARPLSPHGTPARYRWHKRRGEDACHACLVAHRGTWRPEYAANRKARRRAARSGVALDSSSDRAQVLPRSANGLGDDGLVLAFVHGLDNEPVDLPVPAVADGDGARELGHGGHLPVCQQKHMPSASDPSGDLRRRDLTPADVTARIVGNPSTASRLASTADTGRRHTPIQQEESAA